MNESTKLAFAAERARRESSGLGAASFKAAFFISSPAITTVSVATEDMQRIQAYIAEKQILEHLTIDFPLATRTNIWDIRNGFTDKPYLQYTVRGWDRDEVMVHCGLMHSAILAYIQKNIQPGTTFRIGKPTELGECGSLDDAATAPYDKIFSKK
jgi:hypothetical protein